MPDLLHLTFFFYSCCLVGKRFRPQESSTGKEVHTPFQKGVSLGRIWNLALMRGIKFDLVTLDVSMLIKKPKHEITIKLVV